MGVNVGTLSMVGNYSKNDARWWAYIIWETTIFLFISSTKCKDIDRLCLLLKVSLCVCVYVWCYGPTACRSWWHMSSLAILVHFIKIQFSFFLQAAFCNIIRETFWGNGNLFKFIAYQNITFFKLNNYF